MRDDVKTFVELAGRVFEMAEPIVEIGSLQTPGQEGYADLRTLFPDKAYIGCDIVAGPGVDRIENVHQLTFADNSVGSLIAVDMLEHVANPYLAVREFHRVLRGGGVAITNIPFNFPIHHMPDYARFTPEGMAWLLSVFGTTAVFFQGDAKLPHTVYGLTLKGGDEASRLAFEAAAARLQNEWYLGGDRDPLFRFEPLDSIARCDRPDQLLGPLVSGSRVEQHFTCSRDCLTRIDVRFGLTGAPGGGWLTLRLCDEGGAELATVETRASYVWLERWVAFAFPAVKNSAGRRLSFRLECSDPHSTVAPFTGIPGVEIAGAQLMVDGQPKAGTLCFEAFCQRAALDETTAAEEVGTVSRERKPEGISMAMVAARLQAGELRHVAMRLHEAIEKLRADFGNELVRGSVRQEALAEQLVRMEVREGALAEQLARMEVRQGAQAEQLVRMEVREGAQAEQLARIEIRQAHQGDVLDRTAVVINDIAGFIGALRRHWLLRGLSRLAGGRTTERAAGKSRSDA